MKRVIWGGTVGLLIAAGAWYLASPVLAMSGLHDAVMSGDKDEMKERVDFPSVRESLKSQMRAYLVAEMAKEKDDNPFGALGAAFAMSLVDNLIDGIVSPEGMKAMVESGKMKGPEDTSSGGGRDVEWVIERHGFDRFVAVPEVDEGEKVPRMIFKRDGVGWDLVEIEIPAASERVEGDI
ncbi:DUF2939 domain-containing protein [Novosphingobium sp. KN65.2]|uniref:DUF2939 domain-containing protein n=1 Tax=Novosphingobium sp. KN65.2 TaxID=1478134 RepID=UPI0005E4301D|nr:DUF2939 domain-containing protein [Novosphingobium sp. KN65.2]CDO37262.1 conserved exported hypothetical protein [Novosphingobium sp. KN65.2]